jgi:hypothetical protein
MPRADTAWRKRHERARRPGLRVARADCGIRTIAACHNAAFRRGRADRQVCSSIRGRIVLEMLRGPFGWVAIFRSGAAASNHALTSGSAFASTIPAPKTRTPAVSALVHTVKDRAAAPARKASRRSGPANAENSKFAGTASMRACASVRVASGWFAR